MTTGRVRRRLRVLAGLDRIHGLSERFSVLEVGVAEEAVLLAGLERLLDELDQDLSVVLGEWPASEPDEE
ncbi:hypothetical protein [Nocardioides limicola]|uniref:hypothetical protein n=1 Tax=Nocardioides limicola TaxID=2803368 RepID=UPI00193C24B8|nr:hypothetical protein [Nocardioides sp. DJM-14]